MGQENCNVCQLLNKKEKIARLLLYEDDKVMALLAEKPASIGHVQIIPKEHYPIIENVPDSLISHIFVIASKISSAIFDGLNVHGTNIVVQNGISAGQTSAHFIVHIVGRYENDGLTLTWHPKQVSEDEMSTVMLELAEFTEHIGGFEEDSSFQSPLLSGTAPVLATKKPDVISTGDKGEKENYLLKQIDRIP